jgi:hypothetical protein
MQKTSQHKEFPLPDPAENCFNPRRILLQSGYEQQ